MPKTYILIESSGHATMIPEREIQRVAAERMGSGKPFQIFLAEPMKLQVTLAPATGAAPMIMSGGADVGEKTTKTPSRKTRKKGRRKKAGRRKAAAKKTATQETATKTGAKKGTGRVGRPPVNVGPCTVAGCGRPSKTRGLCSAHYQQHRRLVREGKPGLFAKSTGAAAPAKAKAAPRVRRAKKAGAKRGAARRPSARKVVTEKAPTKA